MAFDLKKTLTDTTAIYALVGAADEAVSQVKGALDQAAHRTASLRSDLNSKSLQAKVTETVAGVRGQVEALPATATERFTQLTGEFDKTYERYATRGEKVVRDLRTRPEVERLSERTEQVADQVAEQAQAAVETMRKVAEETQSAALGAVYSTRKQAAQETVKVAETVQSEATTSVRSNAAKEGAAKKTASGRTTPTRKAPAKKTTARKTTAKKASTGRASTKKSDQA